MTRPTDLDYGPALLEHQLLIKRSAFSSSYQALSSAARTISKAPGMRHPNKMELLRLLPDDHPGVLDARAVCGFYCKSVRPDLYQVGVESLRKLLDDHRYRGYVHEHRERLAANAEFYGTPWISLADAPATLYALVDEINAELDRPDRSHEERRRLEERRGLLAPRDTLRHRHVRYPQELAVRLAERGSLSDRPRIALTITTCRRLSLFQESMNSFLNCCLDLDMIDLWILIDDNSSEEDRAEMRRLYPFFHFIEKRPDERGHARGLNMLWQLLLERGIEHCLHLEDDRVFLRPREYIRMALDILEDGAERGVAQVVYSRHYADSWNDWHRHEGIRITRQEPFLRYVIQDNVGTSGPTPPGALPRLVWPHFSLNPSMIHLGRLAREKRLELVFAENHQWFECEFARRYEATGYVTAFPDDIFVLHVGKLFWEGHKLDKDAYELNEHERYGRKY